MEPCDTIQYMRQRMRTPLDYGVRFPYEMCVHTCAYTCTYMQDCRVRVAQADLLITRVARNNDEYACLLCRNHATSKSSVLWFYVCSYLSFCTNVKQRQLSNCSKWKELMLLQEYMKQLRNTVYKSFLTVTW